VSPLVGEQVALDASASTPGDFPIAEHQGFRRLVLGCGTGSALDYPEARGVLVTDERVTVYGLASRSVAPGTATWHAEAVETDADPRAAFERCTSRLNALVEQLAAVGDVSTDSVRVEPHWEENGPAGTRAIGAVRVRCPAAQAGEAAPAGMSAGADRLHGPRFEYDDAAEVGEQLLAEAVADARRKAERLAAAAGRRLGAVRAIDERAGDAFEEFEDAVMKMSAGAPEVRPRDQLVTASVKVAFELEG
jgi:uncharacterized protein